MKNQENSAYLSEFPFAIDMNSSPKEMKKNSISELAANLESNKNDNVDLNMDTLFRMEMDIEMDIDTQTNKFQNSEYFMINLKNESEVDHSTKRNFLNWW